MLRDGVCSTGALFCPQTPVHMHALCQRLGPRCCSRAPGLTPLPRSLRGVAASVSHPHSQSTHGTRAPSRPGTRTASLHTGDIKAMQGVPARHPEHTFPTGGTSPTRGRWWLGPVLPRPSSTWCTPGSRHASAATPGSGTAVSERRGPLGAAGGEAAPGPCREQS